MVVSIPLKGPRGSTGDRPGPYDVGQKPCNFKGLDSRESAVEPAVQERAAFAVGGRIDGSGCRRG
jgi:hypothetical protein